MRASGDVAYIISSEVPAMKHQLLPGIIFSLLFVGCATTQPETSADQPELVSMTSLPPVSTTYSMSGLKLNILFHLQNDGSVSEVKMMKSSGDPDWDRAAVDSMKLWRFTPSNAEKHGTERWIRNTIILQVQEPTVLTLGDLKAPSQQEADSLYALLQSGSDFETLQKQSEPGLSNPRGKFLGAVDIARYPKHVRDALRKLGLNEVTNPLRIGTSYVVFKRYKPDGLQETQQ